MRKLKLFSMLLLLLVGVGQMWGAAGDVVYTLTCTQNSSNTAYATNYNVTINGKQWNAPGNQNAGAGWRIGGPKTSDATNRTITGKGTIDKVIGKITINHNGVSNSNTTITNFAVTVASDASFTQNVESASKANPSVASAGSFDLTPTNGTWASGRYYKFTITYTKTGSGNAGLDLTSIVFYEGGSTKPTLFMDHRGNALLCKLYQDFIYNI